MRIFVPPTSKNAVDTDVADRKVFSIGVGELNWLLLRRYI